MINGMVSCIVPTYKRSDSLLRAVKSILNQTYEHIEIIVVDDNDPNDEYSIIAQQKLATLNDDRLQYIQQEKHINGAAARNVGIKESRGEFIAFLDDDDEWLEDKLSKQVSQLEKNVDLDAVSCLYTYYENMVPIRKASLYNNNDLHRKVLDRSVSILTPTVLFRKKALDKSGYFDESFVRHQDLQLFLDFLSINKMQLLPEYHVKIHIDAGGNRPNSKDFIKIKQHFFKEMIEHFKMYDEKEQKTIYSSHYFEIILVALREKKIFIVLKYLLKIGFNFQAYQKLLSRYKQRG